MHCRAGGAQLSDDDELETQARERDSLRRSASHVWNAVGGPAFVHRADEFRFHPRGDNIINRRWVSPSSQSQPLAPPLERRDAVGRQLPNRCIGMSGIQIKEADRAQLGVVVVRVRRRSRVHT